MSEKEIGYENELDRAADEYQAKAHPSIADCPITTFRAGAKWLLETIKLQDDGQLVQHLIPDLEDLF